MYSDRTGTDKNHYRQNLPDKRPPDKTPRQKPPRTIFSIPYTLSTTIISISLSLHLVLLAPINSCELHNYYLVLSFLLMYSSSSLSIYVFPNKTNINRTAKCKELHTIAEELILLGAVNISNLMFGESAWFSALALMKSKYRSKINVEKEIPSLIPRFEKMCSNQQAYPFHK